MHIAGVVIMILGIVVATFAFAYALLKVYIDKKESSPLISFVSTMAVGVTLLCVMLIPVDIYIVSSDLNSDGSQSDPETAYNSSQALQSVYYALYILLLLFAFLIVPFTYFYFEDDSEDGSVSSRTCAAMKYTAGFLIFFVVLLALGLILKKGKQDDSDWRGRLSNDFTSGEAILSFCIGCLACIGLSAYVVYAAYGLARMPLKLLSRAKITPPLAASSSSNPDGSRTGLLAAHRRREHKQIALSEMTQGLNIQHTQRCFCHSFSNNARTLCVRLGHHTHYCSPSFCVYSLLLEDLELSLRRNQENIAYLQSQYDSSHREWSLADKKQLEELKREQRRLQSLRQARSRPGGATGLRLSDGPEELSCWDKCWNCLQPIRLLIAIPLILVSLLLIVSLTITVVDKLMHSPCGPSCGYALLKTQIINPIDEAFKGLAPAFPIDCLFFGGLVLYIFLACVSGVVGLGVRFFMFHLYSIQKGRTLPNAYLMFAWMAQLMALALNMEILTIAPTYATFGNQFYFNTTSQIRQPCDTDLIGVIDHTCIQTQVGRFINTMGVETSFFNVILFFGNLIFITFFIFFLTWGIFCADNSKKEEVDEFRRLDDLSD